MPVPSLAQLAADVVVRECEPYRCPTDDESYSDDEPESAIESGEWKIPDGMCAFELGAVIRNASTAVLAFRASRELWPAVSAELVHRLSLLSPENPMTPAEVRRVKMHFSKTGSGDRVDYLIARSEGILLVMSDVEVGTIGGEATISYLEKNPDGMPETRVRQVVEELKHHQHLIFISAFNFLMLTGNGPTLQYST